MDTNDLLLRWSHMTLDQIEDEIRTGKDLDSITQLFGAETVAEIQSVSFAPPQSGPREAVVVLPGVMGSLLSSVRGVTALVWINPLVFLQGNARYLRLSEDFTHDGCPEVEIVATSLEKMTYLKMGLTLNRAFDLFEFPYDWRKPIVDNADILADCLKHWAGGEPRRFTLLAHSMGGLVARAYLARHTQAAEQCVKQLIMLGTPNYGATNTIDTLLNGNSLMATVDSLNALNGMTDVVRSLAGVYNLLPAPPEFFPKAEAYPANWNLYDAKSWQIPAISQAYLDNTYNLHSTLAFADPQLPIVQIAGCNLDTLVGVTGDFTAQAALRMLPQRVKEGPNAGDGTVPLWSARLPGANMVYVQEKHGNLPNNSEVLQAVQALIRGEGCQLPSEIPAPRTTILGISFDAQGVNADAGQMAEQPVVPALSAADLAARIRSGTASHDDLKKLQFAF